ncbi:hypothetical protein ASG30_14655 [Ramlibacter sp. Leaf400]|nr:hypothetical protein ASG30_14655 [Ramlibacter sp. Leaf400]
MSGSKSPGSSGSRGSRGQANTGSMAGRAEAGGKGAKMSSPKAKAPADRPMSTPKGSKSK